MLTPVITWFNYNVVDIVTKKSYYITIKLYQQDGRKPIIVIPRDTWEADEKSYATCPPKNGSREQMRVITNLWSYASLEVNMLKLSR